jgi:plasmid maintenance system antidote protein VapI
LTITDAAEVLGVTRQTLNNLVNGKGGFFIVMVWLPALVILD